MDTPEVIWGCLDAGSHLEAARRLLRVQEVQQQLQASYAHIVAAKFPVLSHQWQIVLKFRCGSMRPLLAGVCVLKLSLYCYAAVTPGLAVAYVLFTTNPGSPVFCLSLRCFPTFVCSALTFPGSTFCLGLCQHSAASRALAAEQQQTRWQQSRSWRVQTAQQPSRPSCQPGITGWCSSWSRRHRARQASSQGRCLRLWHRLCRTVSHR